MVQVNTYRFYREENGNWYVDLPEWTGAKAELQMVAGADTMLELIGEKKPEVLLDIALESFPNSSELKLVRLEDIEIGGGHYILNAYPEISSTPLQHELWLCDVTKFVFDGQMPEKLFIKKSIK